MREDNRRIVRYLLGDLPEADQSALEREYCADPEKFDEVWAVEQDLVDRYVRGRLAGRERELFERHYLQSPPHQQRVAFARMLLAAADAPAEERAAATAWARALCGPGLLVVGALAAAVVLLVLGVAWLRSERARPSDERAAERERTMPRPAPTLLPAPTAEPVPSPLPRGRAPASAVFSFSLSPMLVRGADAPQPLAIPHAADLVRLRMAVEPAEGRRFAAGLRTVEGKQVWQQRSLAPRAAAVSVNVPAAKLPPGDYILTLSAVNPTGETEEVNRYYFRVVRK